MSTFASLRDSLDAFLTSHLEGLENEQRVEALAWYCQGLGFEVEAKTAFGLASVMDPGSVQGTRQRMQRALQRGRFSHETIFSRLQETVFESGQIQAYCIDDTGIAKKGELSVGVQRQYSGTLGKVGNCQVVVSLHGVSDSFGACLGLQLYLPESWSTDAERRRKANIPEETKFERKWEIALRLLCAARDNGGPTLPVLADAGYGDSREFRENPNRLGLKYVVGVSSQTTVWRPGTQVEIVNKAGRGRPRKRAEAIDGSEPVLVEVLANELLQAGKFKKIVWRMGTKGPLEAEFAALRVRSAERRTKKSPPSEEQWFIIEREKDGHFKYYFSSMSPRASLKSIVRLAKMRWHIERDYQNMKQELGFDRYEGRSWGGLHRHLAMVALMHAFIALHLEVFSPSEQVEDMDME
ncbi:MAG: IS701 family transposase [Myxococcota bacterium]|nr:IS701 family transposase [Myxococcota bacterium]